VAHGRCRRGGTAFLSGSIAESFADPIIARRRVSGHTSRFQMKCAGLPHFFAKPRLSCASAGFSRQKARRHRTIGRPNMSTVDSTPKPAPAEAGADRRRRKFCDLVMMGVVRSGIVFPKAVSVLKVTYTF